MKPRISLIAAVTKNGVIGRDQALPWNLPEDLQYFKQTTYGSPVIMGRKTYESIGRLLPGRKNVIITRRRDCLVPGAVIVSSIEEALVAAAGSNGNEPAEIFVVGGGEIYCLALPVADRLYITEIDMEIEGDAHFPEWPALKEKAVQSAQGPVRFLETKRDERPSPDGGVTPSYRFLVFDRVK